MRNLILFLGLLGGLASCSGPPCILEDGECDNREEGLFKGRSDEASLSNLIVSAGTLSPAFTPTTTIYSLEIPEWIDSVEVTPTAPDRAATVQINGTQIASGASAPVAIRGGLTLISVAVNMHRGAHRIYGIVVKRSPMSYLKASNTGAWDFFGSSISLWGDTLAVGAYGEGSSATGVNGNQADNSASYSGAVYVFVRRGNTWQQQAYLKASNAEAFDLFGWSVSLWGDTLAVGAIRESSSAMGVDGNQADNSAPTSGAVYVFVRRGTTWEQQAYLKASNTGVADYFGSSVSLWGDTLAVGAKQESSIAAGSGAAYVFVHRGSTWAQQAYLKASNTKESAAFGGSVSLWGNTLAVAAPGEDSNATGVNGNQADNSAQNSGAVYVFARIGTAWTQQAYLKASNTEASDYFGSSVSLSGDILAVGAFGEDSNATGVNGNQADNSAQNSGAVYVFGRRGTAWTQQAYLKASNTDAGDFFGNVSLWGNTLAIGAYYEGSSAMGVNGNQADNNALNSGAVYVFGRRGTTWAQHIYVKASNTEAGDQFGWSLSLWGNTLAVGADRESSNATGVNADQTNNNAWWSGAVYVH